MDQLIHIYQNTLAGGVIFYSLADILVFYSICGVLADKHGVRVAAFSIMPDHFHIGVVADSRVDVLPFVSEAQAYYTKSFNKAYGRVGKLFSKGFGTSLKRGAKDIISALNYINNNPSVGGLSPRAETTIWNFLAYKMNPRFLGKGKGRDTRTYRRAMHEIRSYRNEDKPLSHSLLCRIMKPLCDFDKARLTDYIIDQYRFIDFDLASSFYGSWNDMIIAANSNKGGDFATKEVIETRDYKPYVTLSNVLRQMKLGPRQIFEMNYEGRIALAHDLATRVQSASWRHIEKFLHLPKGVLSGFQERVRVKAHFRALAANPRE